MRELGKLLPSVRELKNYAKEIAFDAGLFATEYTVQGAIALCKGIEAVEAMKIFFQKEIDELYCCECDKNLTPIREFFFHRRPNAPF